MTVAGNHHTVPSPFQKKPDRHLHGRIVIDDQYFRQVSYSLGRPDSSTAGCRDSAETGIFRKPRFGRIAGRRKAQLLRFHMHVVVQMAETCPAPSGRGMSSPTLQT